MAIVYLGIGSNLGNRRKNIEKAYTLLEKKNIYIIKKSSLIETNPVGGPPQGLFFNGVIKVETDLSPHNFLKTLQSIEVELGRQKTVRNGPRLIDLDILFYDDIKINTPKLTIPHPRIFEREFVLIPLKDIGWQGYENY
ncbi:2-amino-4-hydroxy-6-hydroxymethyldihydropteridinepyrophosphokinase [hydrothermal vent metagenome]|uniref:2-amino-4-hydroxy-6-hydroxymethyldihydropteridine diphosphokinase n=1 Tax=hydrothermal vent metagenome TaxID=652676 RepID=A0A3B1DE14_9ZZZZ